MTPPQEHCEHECVCEDYIQSNLKGHPCPYNQNPKLLCSNDTRSRPHPAPETAWECHECDDTVCKFSMNCVGLKYVKPNKCPSNMPYFAPVWKERKGVRGGMLDITAPKAVEIRIGRGGRVVWVNTEEGCVLRICQIPDLTLIDERIRK